MKAVGWWKKIQKTFLIQQTHNINYTVDKAFTAWCKAVNLMHIMSTKID